MINLSDGLANTASEFQLYCALNRNLVRLFVESWRILAKVILPVQIEESKRSAGAKSTRCATIEMAAHCSRVIPRKTSTTAVAAWKAPEAHEALALESQPVLSRAQYETVSEKPNGIPKALMITRFATTMVNHSSAVHMKVTNKLSGSVNTPKPVVNCSSTRVRKRRRKRVVAINKKNSRANQTRDHECLRSLKCKRYR